jgi:hypothetical protein
MPEGRECIEQKFGHKKFIFAPVQRLQRLMQCSSSHPGESALLQIPRGYEFKITGESCLLHRFYDGIQIPWFIARPSLNSDADGDKRISRLWSFERISTYKHTSRTVTRVFNMALCSSILLRGYEIWCLFYYLSFLDFLQPAAEVAHAGFSMLIRSFDCLRKEGNHNDARILKYVVLGQCGDEAHPSVQSGKFTMR